jgi:hypothetical protein
MSKPATVLKPAETDKSASAIEALSDIVERALTFRDEKKPTLTTVAKLAARGSSMLKLDTEQKTRVENEAVLGVCRKLNLIA